MARCLWNSNPFSTFTSPFILVTSQITTGWRGLFLTSYNYLTHSGSFATLPSTTNKGVIYACSGARKACGRSTNCWTLLQTNSLKTVNIVWSLTALLCTMCCLNASHIGCSQWKQPIVQGVVWPRWGRDWWLLFANPLSFGWMLLKTRLNCNANLAWVLSRDATHIPTPMASAAPQISVCKSQIDRQLPHMPTEYV
jgi:hypothetical protein